MEQVKVRIKGQLVSAKYGTLADGHILLTDPAYAKFVIDEMKAGEYVDAPAASSSKNQKKAAAVAGEQVQADADAPHKKAEKTTEAATEAKVNTNG